jgi:hypothetical protein
VVALQRAIMAELTVDEIYKDRLMFQRKVRETVSAGCTVKHSLRLMGPDTATGFLWSITDCVFWAHEQFMMLCSE